MNLDEMKGVWQGRDHTAGEPPDEGTMTQLLQKLDALDREVRKRDTREYIAACLVMGFFGWRAATTPDTLVRIGSLIVILGSMFIIVWSRRASGPARGRVLAADLPLVHFFRRELERVEAQVRLLKSVWWWYLGPTVIGVLLVVMPRGASLMWQVLAAVLVLGVAAAIYWMNVTAARDDLEPLRDELAARLTELES